MPYYFHSHKGLDHSKSIVGLGISVNLLSYSVHERLEFGELKSTRTILQLADRSTRTPKDIIQDILIKIGEFIFSVNFVVLKTEYVANPKA